jgi:hypothetical protein
MSGDILVVTTNRSARRAELQDRCEAQRAVLSGHVADIEQRLRGTDAVLGAIRNVVARPAMLAGGLALLATLGRFGWRSKLSRGLMLLATALRVYRKFKRE